MNRRNRDAAARFAERRRREDEAPRLRAEVPALEALTLEFEERRSGVISAEVAHVRRVVVEYAPALFDVPCADPSCHDGGHELTTLIMRELRAQAPHLEGEDTCVGHVGNVPCERILKYVGTASYRS